MNHRAWTITLAAKSILLIAGVMILPNCENTLLDQIRAESNSAQFPADTVPPEIGDELIIGTVTQTTVALSWGEATDNVTPQGQLEYRVAVASNSGVLGSIESALQQTVAMNWTAATTVFLAEDLQPDVVYWFAVLVRDEAGNTSLFAAKESRTLNAAAPTPGNGPTFSNVQQTSVAVTWTVATDDDTPANLLEYKLVRASSSTAINTVSKADAITGAGLVMDWSTNTLSTTATGLSVYTTYHFAVLVRDSAHNMSIYSPQSVRTLGTQYTVTFNQQGGSTPNPTSKPVHFGSPYGDLPTISRTGYQFGGWWTTASGAGTRIYSTTTVSTASDHQLHARWTARTFTVNLDNAGGTGGSTSVTATFGSPMPPATAPSLEGDVFLGFFTDTEGNGTQYYTETMDSSRVWNIASNTTLHAAWQPLYGIGDPGPGGGIVFYDEGDYDKGWRYMEAWTADEVGTYQWKTTQTSSPGTSTAIGSGYNNTIMGMRFNYHPAAEVVRNASHGGYTDWFLPSKDELNEMYMRKEAIGGFSSTIYWCSSEGSSVSGWRQFFGDGYQYGGPKDYPHSVRATRRF